MSQIRIRAKKGFLFQSLLLLCLLLASCGEENYQKKIDTALTDGDACYALLILSVAIDEKNKEFSPALVRSYLNRLSDLGDVVGNNGFRTEILNLTQTLWSVDDTLLWRIQTLQSKYCYEDIADDTNPTEPTPAGEIDYEETPAYWVGYNGNVGSILAYVEWAPSRKVYCEGLVGLHPEFGISEQQDYVRGCLDVLEDTFGPE